MQGAMILAYATAVGFAASGMISTLLQWIKGRPVAFALPAGGMTSYFLAAVAFAVIGPYIVARSALRAGLSGKGSWATLGTGLLAATVWSTCSGLAVLGFVASLSGVA